MKTATDQGYTDTDILKDPSLTKNEKTQYDIKCRRLQSILSTCGFGVIAFSVWSIIRAFLNVFLRPEMTETVTADNAALVNSAEIQAAETNFLVILFILLFGIIIAEVGLRLFVGLKARAEGKGKKRSIAYIIVAGVLIPYHLFGVIYNFTSLDYMAGGVFDTIVTMVLDISSLISLIELFIAAIMLHRLRKQGAEL